MDYDAQQIIEEMTENAKNVIERPHPVFSGLPVCPFAKKARLQNQLLHVVYPFDVTLDPIDENRMLAEIAAFRTTQYHMAWFIHPDKNLCYSQYMSFFKALRARIATEGLVAFPGHPMDEFSVNGMVVRMDPYPNIQVLSRVELQEAREKLKKSKYYDKLSEYQLED